MWLAELQSVSKVCGLDYLLHLSVPSHPASGFGQLQLLLLNLVAVTATKCLATAIISEYSTQTYWQCVAKICWQ